MTNTRPYQLYYVVEAPVGRTAVELELSPKTTVRLRSMIAGYLRSPACDFVDVVVLPDDVGERLARRLRRVLEQELAVLRAGRLARQTVDPTRVRVVGWRDLVIAASGRCGWRWPPRRRPH